ncbi:uncharacterized protein LOC127102656 isoform X2 [Lathyrus oleraceus]|uniref:uncharacterized protein LOC127102656 isoform X2 n=1 Tax=Pisum sativum TaxID=3888 RepID=UPI0021D08156|nr:uncharacterized protein LOC127102656 isoform X2 [Pisum sativum]
MEDFIEWWLQQIEQLRANMSVIHQLLGHCLQYRCIDAATYGVQGPCRLMPCSSTAIGLAWSTRLLLWSFAVDDYHRAVAKSEICRFKCLFKCSRSNAPIRTT